MKDIEKLKSLQKIDLSVFKIKMLLEEKPNEVSQIESEFNEKILLVKKIEDELKKIQIKHKEKELDLETKEQNVKKQQGQLYQIKSNKEYNALQVEIAKEKADNSILEEEIIGILEEIDVLKQAIVDEKEKLAVQEQKFKKLKHNVEIEVNELRNQLEELNKQRKIIIDLGIKPDILALYERILENKKELAITAVINDSCQGCFLAIRPQIMNELRLGKIVTCENCVRILYVEDNE